MQLFLSPITFLVKHNRIVLAIASVPVDPTRAAERKLAVAAHQDLQLVGLLKPV